MAFDDDKIRIEVEGAQAAAQLEALAGEVQSLEKELEDLNNTAGVTNAEIEGTTRRLGEAKEKFAEASKAVKENADAQEEAGGKTKSLADKYVTLGLKVFGARQVLMAAGEAMRSVAIATDSYSGATKDAIDQTDNLLQSIASLDLIGASKALGQLAGQTVAWAEGLNEVNTELGNMVDLDAANEFRKILKAQGDLVQGHREEVEALNQKAAALSREVEVQQAAGNVQKFVRDAIEETLKAYEKAGEAVPAKLAAQAAALNITTDAQDKTAKSAADLEAAGVKSAEARAKAEAKAAEEVVAALAKEQAAMAAKLAQDEKALADKLAKGSKLDTSQDTTGAQKNVDDLNKSIADLESQPILSADQLNQLDDLKNKAADAQRGMADLNRVFTITRDDFLSESEAADAATSAWDVYLDRLNKAQFEHDRVMDGLDGTANSFDELGGSVDDVGSSVDDLSDSFSGVGDEAKKGADKGKEGLDNLTEGLTQAIPLAEQLRGILQEIVMLGAQADI